MNHREWRRLRSRWARRRVPWSWSWYGREVFRLRALVGIVLGGFVMARVAIGPAQRLFPHRGRPLTDDVVLVCWIVAALVWCAFVGIDQIRWIRDQRRYSRNLFDELYVADETPDTEPRVAAGSSSGLVQQIVFLVISTLLGFVVNWLSDPLLHLLTAWWPFH